MIAEGPPDECCATRRRGVVPRHRRGGRSPARAPLRNRDRSAADEPRPHRGGAALCALGVVHVVGTPPAAHGVDALESGWWWRTAGAPLPAPPVVPEDALWVASAAPNSTGIEAVSAVRFRLGDDEVAPILTLDIVRSTNPLTASLLACPTVGEWEPVHAGAWTSHPTYDCTLGSVAGALSLDGSKVQFDLTTITTRKDIDIVIFAGGAMPVSRGAGLAGAGCACAGHPAPARCRRRRGGAARAGSRRHCADRPARSPRAAGRIWRGVR